MHPHVPVGKVLLKKGVLFSMYTFQIEKDGNLSPLLRSSGKQLLCEQKKVPL